MLGQIAETAGSMGDAYKPVMQQATKPRGKMDDPAHLSNLAQWASRNGDTAAATMYMQQSRDLAAEARRVAKEEKVKADAATMNTATSSYHQALKTGDQAQIDAAYIELQESANVTGTDAFARTSAVEREHGRVQAEADAHAEKLRVATERQALEKLSTEMNNASLEDIPDIVKNADPVVAMAAQRMANTRTAYLANEEKVASQRKLDQTVLSADVALDPALPEESRKALEAEIEQLQKSIDESFINGTFVGGSRNKLEERRRNIADRAFAAANAVHTAEQNEHNKRQGEYRRLIRDAESHSGTKTEREAIKTELKSGNRLLVNDDERKWSEQAITDEWRRQQREAASRAYPEFAPPTATTDDADLPTYTPEQAAELPKGTRFRGEDGNIYTA
jgi:hypothetical protein